MSPNDLTAIAVLSVALADLDPCKHFKVLKDEMGDKDMEAIREAGRAIMKAQATMIYNYYRELREAGFTVAEAFELTKNFKPTLEFNK